jgi:hypothetical protein
MADTEGATPRPRRRRPGPLRRYTSVTVQKILNALSAGATRDAAAGAAGISRATFYRWLEEHETFETEVQEAEDRAETMYTACVAKSAQDGDWRAAAWWLERRRHREFQRRDRLELVDAVRALAAQQGDFTEDDVAAAVRAAQDLMKGARS